MCSECVLWLAANRSYFSWSGPLSKDSGPLTPGHINKVCECCLLSVLIKFSPVNGSQIINYFPALVSPYLRKALPSVLPSGCTFKTLSKVFLDMDLPPMKQQTCTIPLQLGWWHWQLHSFQTLSQQAILESPFPSPVRPPNNQMTQVFWLALLTSQVWVDFQILLA